MQRRGESERAVDAPAAVATMSSDAILRESGLGEVPKLVESLPGVDVVSTSGFFSEINARGFAGYNNRRVQVYMDGIDQSVPFGGFQEYFPRNLLDLESLELVKGPQFVALRRQRLQRRPQPDHQRPDLSQGGSVRLSAGDPSLSRGDLRWAAALGSGWYAKLVGNYQRSDYFTRSRNESVEYEGLPMEPFPVPDDDVIAGTSSLRFDKMFEEGPLLTVEAGFQELDGGRS